MFRAPVACRFLNERISFDNVTSKIKMSHFQLLWKFYLFKVHLASVTKCQQSYS